MRCKTKTLLIFIVLSAACLGASATRSTEDNKVLWHIQFVCLSFVGLLIIGVILTVIKLRKVNDGYFIKAQLRYVSWVALFLIVLSVVQTFAFSGANNDYFRPIYWYELFRTSHDLLNACFPDRI